MDDVDVILYFVIGILCFAVGVCIGLSNGPIELENECIVHNDKIYCEVENEIKD